MPTSRIPAATDALLAILQAAPGLTGTPVYDGPFVTGDPSDAVFVGYDGDPDGELVAVTSDQSWAGIGAKARNETFDIACAVTCLIGSGDVKAGRDRAFALLESVENELRAQPSLGLPPRCVAQVSAPALFLIQGDRGLSVRLSFTVNVQTRI